MRELTAYAARVTAAHQEGRALCEHCSDRGWTAGGPHDPVRPCDCRLRRPLAERMAEAGVAEEYRGCTFSRWSGAVPDPLVRYAALPDGFLLLLGAVGCGKTHLATAILAHHLESGGRGAWRDCQLLLSDMKRRGDDWRWADAEVSRLAAAQLVVLDDFGAERGTDYDLSTLAEIVRRRHAEGRPTVATSNLPLRASSAGGDDLYGREPRIASRLASGLVLELPGRDYRMSGGAR